MKIALFGGSFNPVHTEHVNIVKAAIRGLNLDKVIIIPSHITPLKSGRMAASGEDRLNMCRLAFADVDGAEVSDFELRRGGISYSYLTCREFKKRYPKDDLFFILGADMYESFPTWKYPEEILKCVTLAVCAREKPLKLTETKAVAFGYVGAKVSSTRIRTLAALGESIEEYVDKKTADYIKERSLYRIEGIGRVKGYLTPKRWSHTVRVAVTAAENCARLNIAERTAITAAALHDCAKYLNTDSPELAGFACPPDVPPPVVHQFAGAYVAENTFNIRDPEILEAIKYHSSGRENMSALEKLIFLSDLLEEGRDFEGVENLREEFSRSVDGGLYASLKHQLNYLKATGKPVYPLTKKAFEYLEENKK